MARYLKQSTASTIVLGPFVDDTDGKTAETGLTIAAADVQLSKNGAAFGAANASATHMTSGYYSNVLSTGNTDTLGRLTVIVSESGALPVRLDYIVLDANTYDSIVGGTDKLQVDVVQWEGADATTTSADWEAEAGPTADEIGDDIAARTLNANIVSADADALDTGAFSADLITDIQTGLATASALTALQDDVTLLMVKSGVFRLVRSGTTLTGYAEDEVTIVATWTLDDASNPTSIIRAT